MRKKFLIITLVLGTGALEAQVARAEVDDALLWGWISLFILAAAGVVVLFFSSDQLAKLKRVYERIMQQEKRLEANQIKFLEELGENIYETLQMTTQNTDEVIEKVQGGLSKQEIERLRRKEHYLLNTTQDLVFFLKLKSKRVEPHPTVFNIYQFLQNIFDILSEKYEPSRATFDLKIRKGIPHFFKTDTILLGQVLIKLLENAVDEAKESAHLLLTVTATIPQSKRVAELQMKICDLNRANIHPALKDMKPYYDEKRKEFVGLRVYMVKELLALLGGSIECKKEGDSHELELKITLPIHEESEEESLAWVPQCAQGKRTLIYDSNLEEAQSLRRTLELYDFLAKIFEQRPENDAMPNFAHYDLIILDKEFYFPQVRRIIEVLKKDRYFILILIIDRQSAPDQKKDPLIDHYLFRPINQRNLLTLISKICDKESERRGEFEKRERDSSSEGGVLGEEGLEPSHVKPFSIFIPSQEKGDPKTLKRLKGTVLLAEDNAINQKIFISLLADSKIKLDIVKNGREVLDALERRQYDLVILEQLLPLLSGEDTIKQIRKNPKYDQTPLIICEMNPLQEHRREFYYEIGCDGILPKPFELSQIVELLKHFLLATEREEVRSAALDIKEGLFYANMQEELYIELLKGFVASYGQSASLLKAYKEEGDYEQIKSLLLDMRGLTGTIGAKGLFRVVDDLFRRMKEDGELLKDKDLFMYEREIERLKQAIERYLLERNL